MSQFWKTTHRPEPTTLDIGVAIQPTPGTHPSAQQKRSHTHRILLLDDEADFREVIQEFLDSCSFRTIAVGNGVEGLREIQKDPFDVIICDMMMPKLNGEMFYWAVTRMRPAAGQRFIFVTGHQSQPTIQSFFQRINALVLLKPFKLDALHEAIQGVFRRLR